MEFLDQPIRQGVNSAFLCLFCSIQTSTDWKMPAHTEKRPSALLSSAIQMLIPSRNTLRDNNLISYWRSSRCGAAEMILTRNHEVAG